MIYARYAPYAILFILLSILFIGGSSIDDVQDVRTLLALVMLLLLVPSCGVMFWKRRRPGWLLLILIFAGSGAILFSKTAVADSLPIRIDCDFALTVLSILAVRIITFGQLQV